MSRANAIGNLLRSIGRTFGGRTPPPPPIPIPTPIPAPETQAPPAIGQDAATEQNNASTAATDQACATCPNCPPRRLGILKPHFYGALPVASKRGYFYQNFVCPWHNHNPAANTIDEWSFSRVDFDGLHPAECLLYETKHGHDNFLEQRDWSAGGRPVPQPWAMQAFATITAQAGRQHAVISPHHPDVRLKWVFSESITSVYVYQIFINSGWWRIEREYRPFAG